MKKLFYIVSLILVFACNKEKSIVIPNQPPSLVVNSSLCADSIIRFNLSYTQTITDNTPILKESNAIIIIYKSDTISALETLINIGNGNYISTNIASASEKYFAKIITPKKTYWSADSIPATPQGIITSIDSIFRNSPNFYQIHYSLSDKQLTQNYYGIKMKHYFNEYILNDSFLREEWLDIETIDQILTEDINSKFSKNYLLFTDKYFNNSSINLSFGTSKIINTPEFKTKRLIIVVEQYTKNAFAYYSSINEHIFYQNDPFSQPVSLKGNFNNAYGAFVGKSVKMDTIDFKY